MGKINWNKSVEKNKEIEAKKNNKTLEAKVYLLEKEVKDLKKIINNHLIK